MLTLIVAVAATAASAQVYHPRVVAKIPRVLLLGDSVLDQEGSAAAFALRQAGIDARAEGWWGSSLITAQEFDRGHTMLSAGWFAEAAKQVATYNPDVVAVYLNHNFWPPHPLDGNGHSIDNLWTRVGQDMIRQQAIAFVKVLRTRGAQVFFVAPVPSTSGVVSDVYLTNPIWHAYADVLGGLGVPVIDPSAPIAGPDRLRVATKPDCNGTPEPVRPGTDIHLTRFGAGLAGTALAQAIATYLHVSLHGNTAPGDRTAALVANPAGPGYWLVGCDGGVDHFAGAPALPGAHDAALRHRGVAAAVATATGGGLWLVTTDGTILSVGDAPALAFGQRPRLALLDATGTADHRGIWAVTADGAVYAAGTARPYGSMAGRRLNGYMLAIDATATGKGYWLTAIDGGIFGFGDARFFGSMGSQHLQGPVVAMAATPDNRGYWLIGSDGGVFGFGDARYLGNGRYIPPPYPQSVLHAAPGPTVDIVPAPGRAQGYWTLTDNGRVTSHGAAAGSVGTNNLALFTP